MKLAGLLNEGTFRFTACITEVDGAPGEYDVYIGKSLDVKDFAPYGAPNGIHRAVTLDSLPVLLRRIRNASHVEVNIEVGMGLTSKEILEIAETIKHVNRKWRVMGLSANDHYKIA